MYAFSIKATSLVTALVTSLVTSLVTTPLSRIALIIVILTCIAFKSHGQVEHLEFDRMQYKDTECFIEGVEITIKAKGAETSESVPPTYSIYVNDVFLISKRMVIDTILVSGYKVYKCTYIILNSDNIFLVVAYKQPVSDGKLEVYKVTIIEFDDDQLHFTSSRLIL